MDDLVDLVTLDDEEEEREVELALVALEVLEEVWEGASDEEEIWALSAAAEAASANCARRAGEERSDDRSVAICVKNVALV